MRFLLQKNRQDKESATIVRCSPFDYNKRETRLGFVISIENS